jgi:pimeloyl-ACP methyl ester carboxylesterase
VPPIVSHDGLPIAVLRRVGPMPGPHLVVVHATGFCKETWLPMLDGVLSEHSFLAIDQRGHGDSAAPDPPFDWWDLGRDVLTAVAAVGWEEPVGIGHSSGAAALAMAEIMEPGTFRSLVLVEPIIFPGPFVRIEDNPMAETARRRRRTFGSASEAFASYAGRGPFAGWDDEALRAYVAHGFRPEGDSWALKCHPDVEAEFYRSATVHGAWDRLGEIGCPVLLVAGAGSESHPGSFVEQQASRFPDVGVRTVPDATHFVPMEQPEVLGSMIAGMVGAGS